MWRGPRQTRRILIGAILIVALIAAGLLIINLQAIIRSASDTYSIVGIFFEAPRLRTGSPVWIAGSSVGVVTRIELLPPDGDSIPPFAATLRLPANLQTEIRRDSRIRLIRQRLMGEPVVDLMPGSPTAPVLQPGDTLRAEPPFQTATLVARGKKLRAAIDTLFAEGAALRREPRRSASLARAIEAELTGVYNEFRTLADQVVAGPVPEFIADDAWRRSLERITAAATVIDSLAHARTAVLSDTLFRAAVEDLARQVDALREEVTKLRAILEEPPGFPGRWEEDPALRNAIEATRVQLDSLINFIRNHPWRFFF